MLGQHFVRVGALGAVGRFVAEGAERYPRGARVVCRTARGLEVGEVLSAADRAASLAMDGTLLRRITPQDDLLLARLEKNRDEAYRACADRVAEWPGMYLQIILLPLAAGLLLIAFARPIKRLVAGAQ